MFIAVSFLYKELHLLCIFLFFPLGKTAFVSELWRSGYCGQLLDLIFGEKGLESLFNQDNS